MAMTEDPGPNPLRHALALALVARRHDLAPSPRASAGFFHRAPTAQERWNAVPNVVKLVESAPAPDGSPVVVAEHVEGSFLSDVMRRDGLLDLARAIRLALALGEILESLHNAGLVHGNLRADTVLVVGDDERVLLLPPSIATLTERADQPEIRQSEAADLRAFGTILYEMLAGVGPCHRGHRKRVAAGEARPVPIAQRRRGIAAPLERLVMDTLTCGRAHLDMSEVVNLLWIERERLRGQALEARRTGEYRPLVAVTAVATFVTLGWLTMARPPALLPPSDPPAATVTPAWPLIAVQPALPTPTLDRSAHEVLAAPPAVAATRFRSSAVDSARVPAPRSAPSALTVHRAMAERIVIEPPPPAPSPPSTEQPTALPPAPPPAAEPAPAPAQNGPGNETAGGPALPSTPPPPAPTVTASQPPRDPTRAMEPVDTPKPAPPASVSEVAVASIPPPATDPPPAAGVLLVRGAPGLGAEAGPSVLATGHGASGAAGIIEGRLGPVVRGSERPPGPGLASASVLQPASAGR
jgi:hypothetical protein